MMITTSSLALCLVWWGSVSTVNGFQVTVLPMPSSLRTQQQYAVTAKCSSFLHNGGSWSSSSTALFSSPPPRKPRRSLQKRRKKPRNHPDSNSQDYSSVGSFRINPNETDDFPWDTAESRPLVKSEAQELGEDYWIDEEELRKVNERQKPPVRQPGQVSDEKLWKEVLSPYKQNWIGLASVVVVVLVVIVSQFPELLQTPIIAIPDL